VDVSGFLHRSISCLPACLPACRCLEPAHSGLGAGRVKRQETRKDVTFFYFFFIFYFWVIIWSDSVDYLPGLAAGSVRSRHGCCPVGVLSYGLASVGSLPAGARSRPSRTSLSTAAVPWTCLAFSTDRSVACLPAYLPVLGAGPLGAWSRSSQETRNKKGCNFFYFFYSIFFG